MDVATRERLDRAVDHGAVRMLHESRFSGSFGDGAGNIHDDGAAVLVLLAFLRWEMEFVFDGREGAKEEVAGVSHDGTAAGRDLVSGEKFVESTEDVVDVLKNKIAFVGTFINPFDPGAGSAGMLYGVDYTFPQYPRLVSLSAQGGIVSLALAGDDLLVSSGQEQRLNISEPRNAINLFYPPASLRTPVTKLLPLPPAQSYTKF